ncbi:hypothetical protein PLESTB_000864300 [Pleodorina starrii]|uniref:Peptidase M16 C-terminal domain-containing protein n=1 Tax=Pleodorina starrii TaxID=330485 RepID=A0A9W6BLS3_9CHLO|nr:hypothetical protein PLESTM_001429700 [Pleodorina starrii]GLC54444.1 hypothetical protein PLESTB_000864300 [Pleodorina starrii]GLC72099.1 hypothetical protein PLESTF_001203700 [Pleodorina starrii]
MPNAAVACPRQAPRDNSVWPSLPRPAAQQPATLLRPPFSSPFRRHFHRRCDTLALSPGSSAFIRATRNPAGPHQNHHRIHTQGDASGGANHAAVSTSGRTIYHQPTSPAPTSLSAIPLPQPPATPARARAPPSRPDDSPSPLQAAARSAAALLLATSLTLSTALGPAAAAAGLLLPPPPQQQVSPPVAAAAAAVGGSLSGGAAAEALSSSAAAASVVSAAPPLRFTGPEVLDQLPPLPTEFPPLPELRLPSYTTAKLRNGLRVFVLRDDEVPLVRATLLMRGGQYGSPPDKIGLASLTALVQRAGGSTAHPSSSLDSRLEDLAASIELGAGPQAVSADMQCLAEDAEEVLGLMAELVRTPLLPADKLALYQAQILNALDHQNDSPSAIARRKITKLLYGPDSIYARSPTRPGISSISPADLRAYAAAWERPDAAVLGLLGPFEPREMLALVEREFGDWAPAPGQPEQPPPVPRGAPPAVPPGAVRGAGAASDAASSLVLAATTGASASAGSGTAAAAAASPSSSALVSAPLTSSGVVAAAPSGRRPAVYLVDRPGLTQAVVLAAEPGISLSDPAVYPLDVLGGVFNSFGGQLFDTLRSREGLAYSVSGSWDTPADHQGLFLAGGQTSSPGEFLRSLRQLLARAASEPPSEAELEAAKAETLNSFAFNFASTANQMQRILVYDLIGLPQNFLFQYIQGIEKVRQSDVAAAAAAHLHPERQAVVVVGDREVAQPSLEAAGFEVLPMRLED